MVSLASHTCLGQFSPANRSGFTSTLWKNKYYLGFLGSRSATELQKNEMTVACLISHKIRVPPASLYFSMITLQERLLGIQEENWGCARSRQARNPPNALSVSAWRAGARGKFFMESTAYDLALILVTTLQAVDTFGIEMDSRDIPSQTLPYVM